MIPRYTVLSFDPGMNNLGYCLGTVEEVDNREVFGILEVGTVHPTEYPKEIRHDRKHFSDRIMSGRMIGTILNELLRIYNPDYITSEDAFYNPGRPTAYASLLIAIYAAEEMLYIRYLQHDYRSLSQCKLYKTPPAYIKKVFAISGRATKDDMMIALRDHIRNGDIYFTKSDPYSYNEHEVDAVAVGYTFTKTWKRLLDTGIIKGADTHFTKQIKDKLKQLEKQRKNK